MKTLVPTPITPTLTVIHGIATTTSLDVADFFGKRHKNVLQAIENLLSDLGEYDRLNFQQGVYTLPETGDQQHRMYIITRDGFTLLAMGFTGKKALAFKLAYICAFNRMEDALRQGSPEYKSPEMRNVLNALFPGWEEREAEDALERLEYMRKYEFETPREERKRRKQLVKEVCNFIHGH